MTTFFAKPADVIPYPTLPNTAIYNAKFPSPEDVPVIPYASAISWNTGKASRWYIGHHRNKKALQTRVSGYYRRWIAPFALFQLVDGSWEQFFCQTVDPFCQNCDIFMRQGYYTGGPALKHGHFPLWGTTPLKLPYFTQPHIHRTALCARCTNPNGLWDEIPQEWYRQQTYRTENNPNLLVSMSFSEMLT